VALDWINGFSVHTGTALVFGYALLGATWGFMKTEDVTRNWAKGVAKTVLIYVGLFMALVSLCMLFMDARIAKLWFTFPNLIYLSVIPLITLILLVYTWLSLIIDGHDHTPFLASIGLFLMGYLGLAVSLYPWLIPYHYSFAEAAASGPGLSLMLVGVVPALPLILGYTAYYYYVFRGKAQMNTHIKAAKKWLMTQLKDRPRLKQSLWFLTLWIGSLGLVILSTLPIKWLIKAASQTH